MFDIGVFAYLRALFFGNSEEFGLKNSKSTGSLHFGSVQKQSVKIQSQNTLPLQVKTVFSLLKHELILLLKDGNRSLYNIKQGDDCLLHVKASITACMRCLVKII